MMDHGLRAAHLDEGSTAGRSRWAHASTRCCLLRRAILEAAKVLASRGEAPPVLAA